MSYLRSEVRAEDASRQKVTALAGPGKIGAPSGVLHCTFEEDPSPHSRAYFDLPPCVRGPTNTNQPHSQK